MHISKHQKNFWIFLTVITQFAGPKLPFFLQRSSGAGGSIRIASSQYFGAAMQHFFKPLVCWLGFCFACVPSFQLFTLLILLHLKSYLHKKDQHGERKVTPTCGHPFQATAHDCLAACAYSD